jgi:hypothetical protein
VGGAGALVAPQRVPVNFMARFRTSSAMKVKLLPVVDPVEACSSELGAWTRTGCWRGFGDARRLGARPSDASEGEGARAAG